MTLFSQSMNELEKYAELILTSFKNIRKDEVKIIKTLKPIDLAYKTAIGLQNSVDLFRPLTSTVIDIGRLVLAGIENLNEEERTIVLKRFKVGYHLVNVLFDADILELERGRFERDPYHIKSKNKEFIERLFYLVNTEPLDIETYARPVLRKPKLYTKFNNPVAGELIRHANPKVIKYFNGDDCPLVFDAINKHLEISYVVNEKTLNVYDAIKHEDNLFTLNNKNVSKEQREGIEREQKSTMQIAQGLIGKPFWEHLFYCLRDRMYSSNHYLSHQGSKLAKSLMKLNKSKRLGKDGWKELLIHACNCRGNDKIPIEDRFKYAEDNLNEWMKWANDPINYKEEFVNKETGEITEERPWTRMDDPYGFLAVILEIKDVIDSGKKYDYKSNLIVAKDATCSGLQWLAGASRSRSEGELCNITKKDELGDYYKMIAESVWGNYEHGQEEQEVYERVDAILDKLNNRVNTLKRIINALPKGFDSTTKKRLKKLLKLATEVRTQYCRNHNEEIGIASKVFWNRPVLKKKMRAISKRPCMTFFYSCQPKTMSHSMYRDHITDKDFKGLKSQYCFRLCVDIYWACRTKMPSATQLMEIFVDMGILPYLNKNQYCYNGRPASFATIAKKISVDNDNWTAKRVKENINTIDGVTINKNYIEGGEDFSVIAPLTKFKMTQYYRKPKLERVFVLYRGRRIEFNVIVGKTAELDYNKICSASSPNVVHMLDGQLVAAILLAADYPVVCIHDSFGVLAADATKLSKDIREEFSKLLTMDPLKDLGIQCNYEIDLEYGDLDVEEVKLNQYAFS